jgi:inorganic phosphate transporter, PiT family
MAPGAWAVGRTNAPRLLPLGATVLPSKALDFRGGPEVPRAGTGRSGFWALPTYCSTYHDEWHTSALPAYVGLYEPSFSCEKRCPKAEEYHLVILIVVVFVGLLLAYANGSNDNIKGAATLLGSGTLSYKQALSLATVATLVGSVAALFLAHGLLAKFSGKGLVAPEVVQDPAFATSVALAAGLTVLSATHRGLPISTTHALIGALIGAGLVASPTGIDTATLATGLLLPLLTSPLVAITLAAASYPVLRALRRRFALSDATCVCVGIESTEIVAASSASASVLSTSGVHTLSLSNDENCRSTYGGNMLGVNAGSLVDVVHHLSAVAVCFARGLNDTPKIAALLLVGGLVGDKVAIGAVALAMALGGILGAARVARTMSRGVTTMNSGQGLTANLTTAVLVIGASRFGLPVSTTHVSCGSLFGIGTITRQARWRTIGQIGLAWVITLPMAGVIGASLSALIG